MDDVVIEVANSATSTMVEKVTDQSGYTASIQAYTVRTLDPMWTSSMLKVDEYPLKISQDLFPTGRFGEFRPRDQHLHDFQLEIQIKKASTCTENS